MNFESFFKITYGLYVVSSKMGDKLNGYISNTVFQVTAEPARFAIACSKNNYTAEMIQNSKVFGISVLNKDAQPDVFGTFGYKSGRDIDKFSKFKYASFKTGAPILMVDTSAWFECVVIQTIDVGSHLLFIGDVVENDFIDPAAEPLTYAWYREVKKGKAPKNAPTYIDPSKIAKPVAEFLDKYTCAACGHIYNPEIGEPDQGILPGTRFEDLPAKWKCPVCGADKSDFYKS